MKWITILAFVAAAAAQERTFVLSNAKMEFEGRLVTGAPYTAQAVTETTQILADGNRITRKSSSLIARDSQGRTRREQNLSTVGPWASPESSNIVFINDPVAGTRYTLEPNSKAATKIVLKNTSPEWQQLMEDKLKMARSKEEAEKVALRRMAPSNEPGTPPAIESLGTKTIEGVVAEGKRVTETIAAGRIGNEKAIDVVNETWYSSELQTVIMSKHSDPRSGDVVYTLTNISRAEPDSSMFTIPQDYKVREEQSFERRRQP